MVEPILIGKGDKKVYLHPRMANRHGLIAGATGTGKTVTLQILAEGFSRIGVPVFLADVKGDLSGLAAPGKDHPKIHERIDRIAIEDYQARAYPVTFWDVFGQQGHPVRSTITDMGPLLLSQLLNLNETQEGVMALVFRVADDNGWLLLDLKDLRSMLQFVSKHRKEFQSLYGNISPASVGAIQRRLIGLEEQGANRFFGEPDLNLDDLMQTADDGRGRINILSAEQLMQAPKLYSTILLWLLSELFERLPEVGDPEKPRLVFFFDEAHLLFDDASDALLDKIEQVVRLIRSKGVGIYFVTQNPLDVPVTVLGQLGNRVQHALRAFTPRDRKAVKAAAETFRPNPRLDTEQVITELGVGEGLVSTLDRKGRPSPVERALIVPPESRIGPISKAARKRIIDASVLKGVYDKPVDRESAYEILKQKAEQAAELAEQEKKSPRRGGRQRQTPLEAFAKSTLRAIGSSIGRQIARGILGSLFGRR